MALCAGVGGLEIGLRLAVLGYRCVCYVEREAYAARILVARMEEQALDPAPIWDDVATFDGRPWRGAVDIISAGFPCQPWSSAGRRRGTEDERWLWGDIARVIGEVRPSYVFLENVPGLAHGGLGTVLGDLSVLGFDAEWDIFSARSEGAPHVRKRLFILAHADSRRRRPNTSRGNDIDWPDTRREKTNGLLGEIYAYGGGGLLANPDRSGQYRESVPEGWEEKGWDGEADTGWLRTDFPDPNRQGLLRERFRGGGEEALASTQQDSHGVPGWWEVEPPVGRVVDGLAHRVDRIRACGNGVVPAVAATAYRTLTRRLVQ